jgi:group I intron endonuclease
MGLALSEHDLNLLKHSPGGIYAISIVDDHRVYIGQSVSTKGINERIKDQRHALRRGKHHNAHLQSAFEKYGEDAFEAYVVEACDDDALDEREIYWIRLFHAYNAHGGFNICEGGEWSGVGHPSKRPEVRAKISAAISGENNHFFGKKHSDETRQRMRAIKLGKRLSDEHKARISAAVSGANHPSFGKKISDETRQRISAAHAGKRLSYEHKARISAVQIGKKQIPETIAKRVATRRVNKERKRREMILANLAILPPAS